MVCVTLARLTALADTVKSAEWAHAQGEVDCVNTAVGSKAPVLPKLLFLIQIFTFSKCVFPIKQDGGQLHIQTPNLQHYSVDKM